jgi:hypothetical protein
MKEMRNKMMIMVLGALMVCLVPAAANGQPKEEWQSTSVLMPSGSNYSSQISEVGAAQVVSEAKTTTEVYSPAQAPSGPRRDIINPSNPGNQANDFPVGDAVLPLLVMAMLFAGVVYTRRKKSIG